MGDPAVAFRTKTLKIVEYSSTSLIPLPPAGEINIGLVADSLWAKDENGAVAPFSTELPQTVNPAADSGAGSSIKAGVKNVIVGAVTTDANDWIVLPPIADVPIGFPITIACNAGTNFEMRTPAASGTTINGQDCDGTKEYLCTDTEVIFVTKRTTTGWVATALTALGAVATAVVPD